MVLINLVDKIYQIDYIIVTDLPFMRMFLKEPQVVQNYSQNP